jgi:hypothetical protein
MSISERPYCIILNMHHENYIILWLASAFQVILNTYIAKDLYIISIHSTMDHYKSSKFFTQPLRKSPWLRKKMAEHFVLQRV